MSMRIHLDATVRSSEGEDVGTIERAVIDPRTNEVCDFVVSTGALFGRDVLVPRHHVDRASRDGDAIRLDLMRKEIEDLPAYIPADFVAPPPGWTPPATYAFDFGGYLWRSTYPNPVDTPNVSGRTATPAAGSSGEEATIGKGATVIDVHRETLGVVDEVVLDAESGRVRGFVLRVGGAIQTFFGGGETTFVPIDQVDEVLEDGIKLRIPKDALEEHAS